ncbi:hypothetical protein DFS34DRAFT_653163 [Phlyctochytrium arcticum]|nr:hypothetical protein DFS34DRAFT_653163 [Phlyctochytrium arcticum]
MSSDPPSSTDVPTFDPAVDCAGWVDKDAGLDWPHFYIVTYTTALIGPFLLLATFADAIYNIRHPAVKLGLALSLGAHSANMIGGIIYYNTSNVTFQVGLNFLWAFFSAVEHWAITHMLHARVLAASPQISKWIALLLQAFVHLVFIFTLLDQGLQSATDLDMADYNPVLSYVNAVYPVVIDFLLYGLVAYRVHTTSAILRPGENTRRNTKSFRSFESILFVNQILRALFFMLVEILGLVCGVYWYAFSVPIVSIYTIVKVYRPFIIITDMHRIRIMEHARSRTQGRSRDNFGPELDSKAQLARSRSTLGAARLLDKGDSRMNLALLAINDGPSLPIRQSMDSTARVSTVRSVNMDTPSALLAPIKTMDVGLGDLSEHTDLPESPGGQV